MVGMMEDIINVVMMLGSPCGKRVFGIVFFLGIPPSDRKPYGTIDFRIEFQGFFVCRQEVRQLRNCPIVVSSAFEDRLGIVVPLRVNPWRISPYLDSVKTTEANGEINAECFHYFSFELGVGDGRSSSEGSSGGLPVLRLPVLKLPVAS